MTKEELQAIKDRESRATPGPWETGRPPYTAMTHPAMFVPGYNIHANECDITSPRANLSLEDAEFIASARSDIPRLIAEVERLTAASCLLDSFCDRLEPPEYRSGCWFVALDRADKNIG